MDPTYPIPRRTSVARFEPQAPLSGALPPRESTPIPVAIISSAPPLTPSVAPTSDPLQERLQAAFNRQFPNHQATASSGPRIGVGSQESQNRRRPEPVQQAPTAGPRIGVGSEQLSSDPTRRVEQHNRPHCQER